MISKEEQDQENLESTIAEDLQTPIVCVAMVTVDQIAVAIALLV